MEKKSIGLVKVVEEMRQQAWLICQSTKITSGNPSATERAINNRNLSYQLYAWATEIELQGKAANYLLQEALKLPSANSPRTPVDDGMYPEI